MPSNRTHLNSHRWRFAPVVNVIGGSISPTGNYRLSGGISGGQFGPLDSQQVDSMIPLPGILHGTGSSSSPQTCASGYDPVPAHCRLIADNNGDPCNLIYGMVFDMPCAPRYTVAFTCNNPAHSKRRAHDIFLSILPGTCTSDYRRSAGGGGGGGWTHIKSAPSSPQKPVTMRVRVRCC